LEDKTYSELQAMLEEAWKEIAYYKRLSKEAGDLRLRETEELSRLIAKLKKAEKELEQAKYELEQRVEERTAELSKANLALTCEISERKQAEVALWESRQQFQGLVETLYDWVWETGTEGHYTYISPRIKDVLGYEPEEIIGKTPFENMPAEEGQRISEIFAPLRAQQKPIIALENINLHKDGHPVIMETSALPFYDNNGNFKGYRGTDRDITKRKQEEEALRISEERFQKLLEITPMPICYVNKNGVITFRNARFVKVFGYTNDDVPSLSEWWLNAYPEAQYRQWVIQNWDSAVRHAAETGTDILAEGYQVTCKDGSVREIIISGTTIDDNFMATFFDITDRKQAEEALRESEKQYRTLFEATADTVFLIDQESGSLLDVNPAATRMYGFNREEFLRMTTTDVSAEPEKTAKATSEPVPFIPIRYHRHKDGTVFPVELTASIFELRGRNTIIATARDITERKKREEESKQLELKRQQLQKNESLGRMAGAIAHHFNNQLGVVIGNLEMAIDDLPNGAEPANSLTAAMQAAEKASEMSSLMLTYLGQTSDKRQTIDISEACLRSLPILQATIPNNAILESDLSTPGPVVSANANQIQQVLTNLVTNAWESVRGDRGTILLNVKTVFASIISGAYRFPMDWQPQNDAYACLEVTDNGCGIAEKDIEKLFDPFFTSKFIGRGMGLALVLGIVRAHDGVVTVESELGRGSTFRIFLPISKKEVLRKQDKTIQALEKKGSGTVLLVEDEDMVRDMAAAMLNRLGFKVLEAKDGVEAVEVFREHRNEIRCVLSDLTMPRMNGWETITALRELAPDLPVILASGYDEAHVMEGDHPELPQAFLGKPYKLKGLSDAISHALNNRD
jgi:PAS domain S-box-containing protein